jgi:Skp family chaperone for outer membrane proteins
MQRGTWILSIVVVVIIGVAIGFFVGRGFQRPDSSTEWQEAVAEVGAQIEALSQQVGQLQEKISSLEQAAVSTPEAGAEGGGESLKIAYVDMFRVLQELQDSELIKQALEQFRGEQQKIQQELDDWEKKFQAGEITKKELDEKKFELELKLREINLQLSAPIQRQMLEIIRQIGQEKQYGLILDNPASQLNAIVLYSQSGQADDITQVVIERLKAQLEEQQQQKNESGE